MIKRVVVGTMVVLAGLMISTGQYVAFACTKTNGCVMDVAREDYNMKQTGGLNRAILDGRANIQAFQQLQAAERGRAAGGHQAPARR
jgi:hypothetical protein